MANRFPDRSEESDSHVSPTTSFAAKSGTQSEPILPRDYNMSELGNHRRQLSVLETDRVPKIKQQPPTGGPSPQIAPWMSSSNTPSNSQPMQMSFYNDSTESLPSTQLGQSQQSPGHLRTGSRSGFVLIEKDASGTPSYTDDRRPSVASIATTASSTGSKTSGTRGGFRKLQGFFGEEFPGRDGSDGSLPTSLASKDPRGRSYSHSRSHRGRQFSNATDPTREASPSPARPRTPAPEVVPFLYQDNTVGAASLSSKRFPCAPTQLPHEPVPHYARILQLAPSDLSPLV